jgi:hypothetical protein
VDDVVGSLEHININQFYENFRTKLQLSDPRLNSDIRSFLAGKFNFSIGIRLVIILLKILSENFSGYELLLDEDHNISSQDYMYIYSLILFYSCIHRTSEFFQKCCEGLDAKHQTAVFKFFASLKQAQESRETITKELLRVAIKEAVPPSPHLKFISSSPMKTPVKLQTTPNKTFFHEKSQELKRTKTLLENERYERNMLETEMKQNEERSQCLRKLII